MQRSCVFEKKKYLSCIDYELFASSNHCRAPDVLVVCTASAGPILMLIMHDAHVPIVSWAQIQFAGLKQPSYVMAAGGSHSPAHIVQPAARPTPWSGPI